MAVEGVEGCVKLLGSCTEDLTNMFRSVEPMTASQRRLHCLQNSLRYSNDPVFRIALSASFGVCESEISSAHGNSASWAHGAKRRRLHTFASLDMLL